MLTALANYQALAQLIQPRATCDNISVGNKLGLSDIYMSPVVKLLLHTKSNTLTKQKAKTFGVCHTRGCDTGGEQPRVVAPRKQW